MKSKKSDIIKNCLKKGSPTAALVGSIVSLTCGCGDNNAEVKPPVPKPAEKMPDPGMPSVPPVVADNLPVKKEVKKYTEKLVFNDRDFTKNFSKLSASGKKKLNRFVKNISRKHAEILYSRGKDGSTLELEFTWGKAGESDANKRKKARTVLEVFWPSDRVIMAGKRITPAFLLGGKIADTINKEFNFRADKSRW